MSTGVNATSAGLSEPRAAGATYTPGTAGAADKRPTGVKPSFAGFKVPAILSWKNPYETGVLLAEVLGLFVVLSSSLTLRLFFRFASSVIGVMSVAEWGSRAISGQRNGLVSTYQPSRFLPFNDNFVHDVSRYLANQFSRATFGVQHLIDARDPIKGLKLSVVLYVAYVLLGFFTLKGLVLTGIILAFSLPPLYLQFQPEVDQAISDLQAEVHRQTKLAGDKIYAKAGPQIDYVKKLVGPRGGFPGHANVSPVGDVPTAAAKPTPYTTGTSAPAGSAGVAPLESLSQPGAGAPAATLHTTTTTTTTHVPEEVFKNFDSVPTLAGTLPIDQEKLAASLAADRAKAEGSLNGL